MDIAKKIAEELEIKVTQVEAASGWPGTITRQSWSRPSS